MAVTDSDSPSVAHPIGDLDMSALSDFLQEYKHMTKGKGTSEDTLVNDNYFPDFAGISTCSSNVSNAQWIIDSGVSSHITGIFSLLVNPRPVKGHNTIT